MKKKKYGSLIFNGGIGSSSLLLIFIVLCLVSFATLSMVSANADYKLSTKVLDRISHYYDACSTVEKNLASLDTTLQKMYEESSTEEDYYNKTGKNKRFSVPISELQYIQIEVDILYPKTESDSFYKVVSRQLVTTADFEFEGDLNVIP